MRYVKNFSLSDILIVLTVISMIEPLMTGFLFMNNIDSSRFRYRY